MTNEKLSFAIDADSIEIRPLLDKDFLELSMKAISTANPNRNNSWFTKESLERSLDSFKNKPILGYFEDGDFVSHNGKWVKDPETQMDYWDTLGTKGERILGLIRNDDEVKIVEDKDGLSWICLTCALWVQYSYKQVKRLLKDAKKAIREGKPAKNISVEIDITDYEDLDNGVRKINAFNLVGITILGSRNGVKVEPGIEDAQLSVIDIMGNTFYEKQKQAIRIAYEKLDNSEKENNKEEFSDVENIEEIKDETILEGQDPELDTEEVKPESGEEEAPAQLPNEEAQEPVETVESAEPAQEPEAQPEGEKEPENFEGEEESVDNQEPLPEEQLPAEEEGNPEQSEDNKDPEPSIEEQPGEELNQEPEEQPTEGSEEQEPVRQQNCEECCAELSRDPVFDVAYLIEKTMWNVEEYNNVIAYYENSEDKNAPYIVAVLKRFMNQAIANQKELSELLEKVAGDISEEELKFAQELADHYDCHELYKTCIELEARCNAHLNECGAMKAKLEKYEKEEFMAEAKAVINSVKNISEEDSAKFIAECENGNIKTIDELKVQVALAATFTKNPTITETFNAPIDKPSTNTDFSSKKPKSKNPWDALHEYLGK